MGELGEELHIRWKFPNQGHKSGNFSNIIHTDHCVQPRLKPESILGKAGVQERVRGMNALGGDEEKQCHWMEEGVKTTGINRVGGVPQDSGWEEEI